MTVKADEKSKTVSIDTIWCQREDMNKGQRTTGGMDLLRGDICVMDILVHEFYGKDWTFADTQGQTLLSKAMVRLTRAQVAMFNARIVNKWYDKTIGLFYEP